MGERGLVTRTGIGGALRSRDTVREGGIERDGKEREERIEEIEGEREGGWKNRGGMWRWLNGILSLALV